MEFLVHLKVPDVVASTAKHTLKHILNYRELEYLDRFDYWKIEGETEVVKRLDAALEGKNDIVNTNKQYIERKAVPELKRKPATAYFSIIVKEKGEDSFAKGMQKSLSTEFGDVRVERGTLWVLGIASGDAKEARKVADEIAMSTHQNKGLLSNPHYQDAIVRGI